MELANAVRMLRNLGLHVIKYPSGRYGFFGRVPVDLAYTHIDGSAISEDEAGAGHGPIMVPPLPFLNIVTNALSFTQMAVLPSAPVTIFTLPEVI